MVLLVPYHMTFGASYTTMFHLLQKIGIADDMEAMPSLTGLYNNEFKFLLPATFHEHTINLLLSGLFLILSMTSDSWSIPWLLYIFLFLILFTCSLCAYLRIWHRNDAIGIRKQVLKTIFIYSNT